MFSSSHPISISLIAGDVLFNLRAALDHLAYQLALANGTSDESILRKTYFPIFESAEKFSNELCDKTPGMSEVARAAIKDVKPYKGGNNLLWQLQRLNNRDKHRTLVTIGSALGWHSLPIKISHDLIKTLEHAHARGLASDWDEVLGSHQPSEIVDVNVRPAFRKCPLEKGDELALAWDDPAIDENSELKFRFEIAFSEPDIIQSEPVLLGRSMTILIRINHRSSRLAVPRARAELPGPTSGRCYLSLDDKSDRLYCAVKSAMKKTTDKLNGRSPNGRKVPGRKEPSQRFDLVQQADEIERILQQAVDYELSIHKRLGNPVAAWRDGKVVIIPPEEIVLSSKS